MVKIKGFESYVVSREGKVVNTRTGRVLKYDYTNVGYARVTLSENGKLKREAVHRIVAKHYIPNPDNSKFVNHKNGVKTDNRVENLEWVTCQENTVHAFDTGLRASGEDSANAKLTNTLVEKVCELIQSGLVRSEVLSKCNLTKYQFDDIRRRKTWKKISQHYKW